MSPKSFDRAFCPSPKHKQVTMVYRPERGASLMLVMLILIVTSILGIGGAQIALMGERSARNDRDYQLAWQSAEAALMEAEFDIRGGSGSATRTTSFDSATTSTASTESDCSGTSGSNIGLCMAKAGSGKPVWLTTSFTATDSPTVEFGAFTGRSISTGSVGVKAAKNPRYLIELLKDKDIGVELAFNKTKYIYRVTAMGFGPREDIQAVAQMVFRKE